MFFLHTSQGLQRSLLCIALLGGVLGVWMEDAVTAAGCFVMAIASNLLLSRIVFSAVFFTSFLFWADAFWRLARNEISILFEIVMVFSCLLSLKRLSAIREDIKDIIFYYEIDGLRTSDLYGLDNIIGLTVETIILSVKHFYLWIFFGGLYLCSVNNTILLHSLLLILSAITYMAAAMCLHLDSNKNL